MLWRCFPVSPQLDVDTTAPCGQLANMVIYPLCNLGQAMWDLQGCPPRAARGVFWGGGGGNNGVGDCSVVHGGVQHPCGSIGRLGVGPVQTHPMQTFAPPVPHPREFGLSTAVGLAGSIEP